MSVLDDVLEELAELVAAKVLAKMSAPSSHYTTRAAGPHVPGKSRAWALRNLKTIPGAKKCGRDWVVSVDAYEAWLSERDAARIAGKSLGDAHHIASNDVLDVASLVEGSIAASGYRRVRSSAR
jgi:hypothetical protein